MSTITFSDKGNSFDLAAQKMNHSFVPKNNQVTIDALVKMTIAGGKHTEAFQGTHWGPNWQQIDGREDFPSGFQFMVNKNSQVIAPLFSEKQMYGVQMAFPLDAGAQTLKTSKGTPIDDTYFTKYHDLISNSLNMKISDELLSATSNTNFAGIFASETRSHAGYEKKHFVVVRYSDLETSKKIAQRIKDAKSDDKEKSVEYIYKLSERNFVADPNTIGMAAPHTTWEQLFVGDREMIALRERQTAMCANMVLQTIHACGLGPVAYGEKKTVTENLDALLKSPQLVTTVFHDVDHTASKNLAYLSEMGSINSASNGFVFRDKPDLGITLYGASQFEPSNEFIGVPSGVGMMRSVRTHNTHESREPLEALQTRAPFIWDIKKGAYNTLLSKSLYKNAASDDWLRVAKQLGLTDEHRTVQYLKPIVVKLSSTDQPQQQKKK